MRTRSRLLAITAIALFGGVGAVSPAGAQDSPPSGSGSPDEEIDLVYERESFVYTSGSRRDPFRPLIGGSGLGPRLSELTVRGILYAQDRSVVMLADKNGKTYRLRRGQLVGNARVIEIRPSQVRFAVDEFGVTHQEVLELKRERKGTGQ